MLFEALFLDFRALAQLCADEEHFVGGIVAGLLVNREFLVYYNFHVGKLIFQNLDERRWFFFYWLLRLLGWFSLLFVVVVTMVSMVSMLSGRNSLG